MELIQLKRANCKNCYKCIRHCPVKSIRFSGNQAYIMGEECIYCGQCFVVCPQDAKVISDSTEEVKTLLMGTAPVVASLAPSFVANFDGAGIKSMEKALTSLGFSAVEETALGATLVKNQYESLLRDKKQDYLISTACPTINMLVQRQYPGAVSALAPVVTPMHAHCLDIKKRIPQAKTVFIGPCISKKKEAQDLDGVVDAVMTFEELSRWMEEEGVVLSPEKDNWEQSKARIFPTAGGILKSMNLPADNYGYQVLAVDGLEACKVALEDIEAGRMAPCFVEMSACAGSCIGGPVMEKYHPSPVRDFIQVAAYAGPQDFQVDDALSSQLAQPYTFQPVLAPLPSEKETQHILQQMGKTTPEDQLNCGSCGYNTCREKATAVFQGKAELSMCMPFLSSRAESFSDNIIQNTPNGILVLNGSFEIQQINRAACHMFSVAAPQDVLGEPVVRLLDPTPFLDLQDSGRSVTEWACFLPDYGKYVVSTLIYEKEHQIFIAIMTDVTEKKRQTLEREQRTRQTAEIADKVIDKQMHIVQEIASLLGETTAETKVALTKLKEFVADE